MRWFLLVLSLMALDCVTPPIYGLRFHTTPELPELEHVAILVVDRGSRDGYEQSFKKMFGDRQTYQTEIAKNVSAGLHGPKSREIVELDEELAEKLLENTSGLPFETSAISEVFSQLDPKFTQVLVVTRWRISRDYSYHSHMSVAAAGPPGAAGSHGMTNSRQSICKVELSGALFERDGTLLEAGRSQYGESVAFFAFGTALKNATVNSSLKLAELLTRRMPEENIEDQQF